MDKVGHVCEEGVDKSGELVDSERTSLSIFKPIFFSGGHEC